MSKQFFLSIIMVCLLCKTHAQKDSAKLYQKIDNLLTLLNMQESQDNNANASVEQTLANAPVLNDKKDSVQQFFSKYMGWNAVKTDMKRLYAKYYSEPEIDELIRFYSSPAGKKSKTTDYQIAVELNKIATENLQAHAAELNRLLPIASTPSGTPAK